MAAPYRTKVLILLLLALTIMAFFLIQGQKAADTGTTKAPNFPEAIGEVKPPVQINPPGGDEADFKQKVMQLRNRHNDPDRIE